MTWMLLTLAVVTLAVVTGLLFRANRRIARLQFNTRLLENSCRGYDAMVRDWMLAERARATARQEIPMEGEHGQALRHRAICRLLDDVLKEGRILQVRSPAVSRLTFHRLEDPLDWRSAAAEAVHLSTMDVPLHWIDCWLRENEEHVLNMMLRIGNVADHRAVSGPLLRAVACGSQEALRAVSEDVSMAIALKFEEAHGGGAV